MPFFCLLSLDENYAVVRSTKLQSLPFGRQAFINKATSQGILQQVHRTL